MRRQFRWHHSCCAAQTVNEPMKHSLLRIQHGAGGIAVLRCREVPARSLRCAFAVLPAICLAWAFASPPAAAQSAAVPNRPALIDEAGRGSVKSRCPSLVDGQGATVRSRGTGGAAESSFARECPGVAPVLVPAPAPVPEIPVVVRRPARAPSVPVPVPVPPVPDLSVPGLAAGTVETDVADGHDLSDQPPLVVRATPERLSATVLTSGTTLWLLHSGFWTYLLLLGLPLWRHVDLLPIVDSAGGSAAGASDAADADEERAVARVLQGRGWSRRGKR